MTVHARELVELALSQQGKPYVWGSEVSVDNADPASFDCSEIVEWVCARLGVEPRVPDGSWIQLRHALKHGTTCSVAEALRTPGALLFRFRGDPLAGKRPEQAHVAISLGDGRTIEAKSRRDGVGVFSAPGRGWTHAARIPGVRYDVALEPEAVQVVLDLPVLRPGDRGRHVAILQQALNERSIEQAWNGQGLRVDGVFGPRTLAALKQAGGDAPVGAAAWAALLRR